MYSCQESLRVFASVELIWSFASLIFFFSPPSRGWSCTCFICQNPLDKTARLFLALLSCLSVPSTLSCSAASGLVAALPSGLMPWVAGLTGPYPGPAAFLVSRGGMRSCRCQTFALEVNQPATLRAGGLPGASWAPATPSQLLLR